MSTSATWHDLIHPGDATDFFGRQTFPPFDPGTKQYNRDNARWLMELSRLVYRHDLEENNPPPQPTRTSFLAKANFEQRKFLLSNSTNTQAMLVQSTTMPTYAVLIFRGTEPNSGDFKTDLEVWGSCLLAIRNATLPTSNAIVVHEGFKEALDSVWDDISAELAMLQCPVFYTGHSLGAALATLVAARRAPAAVYTFGSPRVGNSAFAHSLANIPLYRIVDGEDLITTLPPGEFGFVHVGEEQRLTASERDFTSPWDVLMPKNLADHAPINYVDRI